MRAIPPGSLKNDLESLALLAEGIMAALSQNVNAFHSPSKQLINKIFDQKFNKIIEAIQSRIREIFCCSILGPGTTITDLHHPCRFQHGPRQTYRPSTFNQRHNFNQPKKRPFDF